MLKEFFISDIFCSISILVFLIDYIYLLKFPTYLGMLATFFCRFFNTGSTVISKPVSYSFKFKVISESIFVTCFISWKYFFPVCFFLLRFFICLGFCLIFAYFICVFSFFIKFQSSYVELYKLRSVVFMQELWEIESV